MASDYSTGSLTVRVGAFARHIYVTRIRTQRFVTIGNCQIIQGGEIGGQNFYNEPVTISVYEIEKELWSSSFGDWDPDKIGALSIRGEPSITVSQPTQAFAQTWAAAEATDGVTRSISFAYKIDGQPQELFDVTEASLSEVMPEDAEFEFINPKTGRPNWLPPRKHPVATEIQTMRKELMSMMRATFWIVIVCVAIISFVTSIRKWFFSRKKPCHNRTERAGVRLQWDPKPRDPICSVTMPYLDRRGNRMRRRKKKQEERLPWYRKRGYKGDLTEDEKRELDSFRFAETQGHKHPAADWDDLPEEVRSYISKTEIELYDKQQQGLVGQCFLLSGIGGFILLNYFGWIAPNYHSFGYAVLSAILLMAPWIYYSVIFDKNAKEFWAHAGTEGIRTEWELEYVVSKKMKSPE